MKTKILDWLNIETIFWCVVGVVFLTIFATSFVEAILIVSVLIFLFMALLNSVSFSIDLTHFLLKKDESIKINFKKIILFLFRIVLFIASLYGLAFILKM
jgi:hypothetical protein